MGLRYREFLSRTRNQEFFQIFFLVDLHSHWRYHWVRVAVFTLPSPFLGLRNPPRPLLVAGPSSTGSSDSDGGLFAVPTTLPPNSRHGKLFSPNKETELTFLQHLNSISVSEGTTHSLIPPPLAFRPMFVEQTRSRYCFPHRCSRISSCQSPGSCRTGTCGSRWWSRSGTPVRPARAGLPCPLAKLSGHTGFLPCFGCSCEMGNPCPFLPFMNRINKVVTVTLK